ncbi:MAG: dihydrodipicolinate synthase family protein [SAR202 cluster bacterium]|nr:dihydrodipicolinate synthase family protein [SAR202 cluster bacterium]
MSTIPERDSIPIVAPTPTPFDHNDKPDLQLLEENISRWVGTGLSGFVIGSYGGEEFHLSQTEKTEIIKTVSQAHQGQKFVIAGIDTLSPTVASMQAEEYAKVGADMVRVRIPKIPDKHGSDSVVDYFEMVARNSPVPVIPIHQPKLAMDVDATPEEIGEITNLEGIYAYIISLNFRWESRLPSLINPQVQLWTCNGSLLMPGAMIGAEGACLFFANWAPDLCRKVISLVKSGNFNEAQIIQESLVPADYIGMSKGVAALKSGLNLLGYKATKPRKPTPELSKEEVKELKHAFQQAGIL